MSMKCPFCPEGAPALVTRSLLLRHLAEDHPERYRAQLHWPDGDPVVMLPVEFCVEDFT